MTLKNLSVYKIYIYIIHKCCICCIQVLPKRPSKVCIVVEVELVASGFASTGGNSEGQPFGTWLRTSEFGEFSSVESGAPELPGQSEVPRTELPRI